MAQDEFSKKRAQMFLNFLAETGRVNHSAQMAGLSNANVLYRRRKTDPLFREAWDVALEQAGDTFESEAVRRGKDGYLKDVYYKGEVVGQERMYSDGLLAKLMDGSKPDKYQRKRSEIGGEINVRVGIAVIPMQAPSVDSWEQQAIETHQANQALLPAPKPQPQAAQNSGSIPVKVVTV